MKSQGTFEYILLLGGIIVLVLLVINQLIQSAATSSQEVKETVNVAYQSLKNEFYEQLNRLNAP